MTASQTSQCVGYAHLILHIKKLNLFMKVSMWSILSIDPMATMYNMLMNIHQVLCRGDCHYVVELF